MRSRAASHPVILAIVAAGFAAVLVIVALGLGDRAGASSPPLPAPRSVGLSPRSIGLQPRVVGLNPRITSGTPAPTTSSTTG